MSNVTLGGNSIKILAANEVNIFNGVVVTIGGPNPAEVYTNNANYTGFGGNGTRTGTFAGAGANDPLPLDEAPPFGPPPSAHGTRIHPRQPVTTGVINVSSSDELLALLDDFTPGRGGRIRIPDSERGSHGRNASRFNAAAYLNAVRRAGYADRVLIFDRGVCHSELRSAAASARKAQPNGASDRMSLLQHVRQTNRHILRSVHSLKLNKTLQARFTLVSSPLARRGED